MRRGRACAEQRAMRCDTRYEARQATSLRFIDATPCCCFTPRGICDATYAAAAPRHYATLHFTVYSLLITLAAAAAAADDILRVRRRLC